MRSVLSISIPQSQKAEIEKRAKKANRSTSAYIIYAVELEKSLISEDELVKMAAKATADYKAGRTEELTSLADLMQQDESE